jgi:hypothetical protein
MPDPTTSRLTVTDSTLLVLRFAGSIPEEVDDALATLRDTTPGSVIVVDDTIREVLAVQRTDAEEALTDALTETVSVMPNQEVARDLLDTLREAGWALIRLDQ